MPSGTLKRWDEPIRPNRLEGEPMTNGNAIAAALVGDGFMPVER